MLQEIYGQVYTKNLFSTGSEGKVTGQMLGLSMGHVHWRLSSATQQKHSPSSPDAFG